MNVQSILVLVVIFVLLGIAIGFICNSKQGWQGGCSGHCATCHQHCSDQDKAKKSTKYFRLFFLTPSAVRCGRRLFYADFVLRNGIGTVILELYMLLEECP